MQYEYVHQIVNSRSEFMTDKKIAIQFTVVTFIIAYATAGALIFLVSLVIESITLQIHLDNLRQTSLLPYIFCRRGLHLILY